MSSKAASLLVAALLSACGSDPDSTPGPADAGRPEDAGSLERDATAELDSSLPEYDAAVDPLPGECPDLFDPELLPAFEVEIDPEELEAIEQEFVGWADRVAQGLDPKPYHPLIEFRYGDEVVLDAMIRLKGNPCCSWYGPKMQFAIAFNQVNRDGRFHGLRRILLDAPPYDATLLRERLALSFMRDAGLPASCANNAVLWINGERYGVYAHIEAVDQGMLERNFGDEEDDGNLYKYDWTMQRWELETNEESADFAPLDAFLAAPDVATVDALTDLDEALLEWAGEAIIPDVDGYWIGSINFLLYDHPARGIVFIPWDMDYTFDLYGWWPDPVTGAGGWAGLNGAYWLSVGDPATYDRYVAALTAAFEHYDESMEERLDAWSAQIAPEIALDPRLAVSVGDHDWAVAAMRDHLGARRAFLDEWLGCANGAIGADQDGDGVGSCDDCDDGNPAVHPGAAESCNGLDDDCSGVPDDPLEGCPDCIDVDLNAGPHTLCTRPRTWDDAGLECAAHGGVLATPATVEEHDELVAASMAVAWGRWWIGANDRAVEDDWVDPAGSPVAVEPWAPDRPNGGVDQNCVALDPELGGGWNDAPCWDLYAAICAR